MNRPQQDPIAEAADWFARGDLVQAERAILAMASHNDSADSLHLLGIIRMQQNRLDEALTLLNRSLTVRPGHPHALINLAKVQRAMNRSGNAVRSLEAVLAAQPQIAEAWYELGMNALQQRDEAAAEQNFRKALALEPGHLPGKLWLGVTLRNVGRPAEAEPLLAGGFAQADEAGIKGEFAYNLAHAQYSQGKIDLALENFGIAARLDDSLRADINRADLLEELLRMDEAVETLEGLLARDPANGPAHIAYNNLLHRLGRDDQFLKSYDLAPQNGELQIAKAGLLLKAGQREKAHDLYAGIAMREPGNLEAAIGAATALNEMGRPAEAAGHLERALSRNPKSAALYQNLASTALQNRDPQKAAAMAEKSLLLSPVDQSGLAVLGSAWRMMGDDRDEMLNGYDELIGIFDLEPPDGFSDMAEFNKVLGAWLEARHPRTREPLMQSLRGGSQTRGYIFNQGHQLVEKLRLRIDEAIARYIAATRRDTRHPFRGRCGAGFRYTDSWSSRLNDCGFHINHIHPGGWISSCYYVALPDVVKDESRKEGWIKFGEPSFDTGLGVRRMVQPAAGRLVLFPSYMWHGTTPFHQTAVRMTIAFDAVPRA